MNSIQAINAILNSTQAIRNKKCEVTTVDGLIRYVWSWDACTGIAVRLYLLDSLGRECGVIKVDHTDITSHITHVESVEIVG